MSMIDLHKNSRKNPRVIIQRFIQKYNPTKNIIYGLVEGGDDPSFYRNKIEQALPHGWSLELILSGGKDILCAAYPLFNWSVYPKNIVLFFIDRDLSSFVHESVPEGDNIFVTDGYSIENYLVESSCVKSVFLDIYNMYQVPPQYIDVIIDIFFERLKIFYEHMVLAMSWVIYWRRKGFDPALCDVRIEDIFKFDGYNVSIKFDHPHCIDFVEYLHEKCHIFFDCSVDISAILEEFKKTESYERFIRGKYVSAFCVKLYQVIYDNICIIVPGLKKKPPIHTRLGSTNFVTIVGPKAKMPATLRLFLEHTCLKSIDESPKSSC